MFVAVPFALRDALFFLVSEQQSIKLWICKLLNCLFNLQKIFKQRNENNRKKPCYYFSNCSLILISFDSSGAYSYLSVFRALYSLLVTCKNRLNEQQFFQTSDFKDGAKFPACPTPTQWVSTGRKTKGPTRLGDRTFRTFLPGTTRLKFLWK